MSQSKTYNSFRTSLNLAMGSIYVLVGIVLFTMRHFGTLELDAASAYVLGTIMLLYGSFRLYQALSVLFRKRGARRAVND